MSLAAGLAVCAAVAGYVGYSCQNAVERKEKELEFLHLSRPAAVRDVYDQLQARKDKGLDPSGVFEVAARTWCPLQDAVRARMDGDTVVLSRVTEADIIEKPVERKTKKNGREIREYEMVREERINSSYSRGDRLRLVDKSSFEGTGVNAIHGVNMPITHEGFDSAEDVAGVKSIDVDANIIPESVWLLHGIKREYDSNINVHVNTGGKSQVPVTRTVGQATIEHVIPRNKPLLAIGECTLEGDRVVLSPPSFGTPSVVVPLVLHYGGPSDYRAATYKQLESMKTMRNISYGAAAILSASAAVSLARPHSSQN